MFALSELFLVVNVISTLLMTGMILMVQLVNYPLFAYVGSDHFKVYHQQHVGRIGLAVGLPMLLEAFSSVLMLYFTPAGVSLGFVWAGVGLVFFIWLITLFCSIPAHDQLKTAFVSHSHRFLILSNWLRTIAWFFRSIIVVMMVLAYFQAI